MSPTWPFAPVPAGAVAGAGRAARAVVVTGASSGIGLATAACLARRGDLVLMGSRNVDDCERVAARLRRRGAAVFAAHLDLSEANSIDRFVESAHYLIGDIDVLVTEGGLAEPHPAGLDLVGVQHLATHLVPAMIKAGRGDVVVVSPPARHRGLEAWLSVLDAEFIGTGVRASIVRPAAASAAAGDLARFIAAMVDPAATSHLRLVEVIA